MSRLNPGVELHNDVWGWHDPATGREAAIFGSTTGFWVIETTDPRRPVSRAFFPSHRPWTGHVNMDLKVWRGYAYAVTEGGGGLKIVDLRDLDHPKLVKIWGAAYWTHAHNMGLDRDRGILVVGGTGGPRGDTVRFVDVDTDPENPRLLASWSSAYVHDSALQHGLLHVAENYTGFYAIHDARNPTAIKELTRLQTPRKLPHNVWPSYDDKISVTTDENWSGGWMAVYDIANPKGAKLLSEWKTGPAFAIVHNAFLFDYVAHVAYYTEGYRCVDLSDPANPVEVGFYDTFPGEYKQFMGAWGCYCYQPSGVVYVSDRNTGLYVLKPKATTIRYGKGTPGTGGKVPSIHAKGASWIGNRNFKLGLRDAVPQSAAVLTIGGGRANLDVQGLRFNVWLVEPPPILVIGPTSKSGELLIDVVVPNVPSLAGAVLDAQFFVVDRNGAFGWLAASQGLEFELFNR